SASMTRANSPLICGRNTARPRTSTAPLPPSPAGYGRSARPTGTSWTSRACGSASLTPGHTPCATTRSKPDAATGTPARDSTDGLSRIKVKGFSMPTDDLPGLRALFRAVAAARHPDLVVRKARALDWLEAQSPRVCRLSSLTKSWWQVTVEGQDAVSGPTLLE